jgi:serine/threonine protein kinase/DNA-binding beta-propeller fold protein YncE
MAEISIGSVLSGYRIEGVAGEGGMGRVYRATQIALNRQVALKVIMPELAYEADFRARFTREAELAASIDHPNIIPVYEAGEADGRLFIAMRWVDGTDLRSVILREGRLDPGRAVEIVEQVAAALDAAHRGGLVHRDVKPANVMLTSTHGQEHVYLTDFGLTKRAESVAALTRTGAFVGTPDYMPPEQIQGQRPDARTDVYALGCLLFQALTGRPPYDRGTEIAKMYAHLHDPPPSVLEAAPGTPADLDGLVSRALAKDPDERYPSAGDLARAARAALTGGLPSQPERSLATGLAAPAAFEPTAPGWEPTPTAGSPGPTAAPATPPPATPSEAPPTTPATPPSPPPATSPTPPEPGPTAMPSAAEAGSAAPPPAPPREPRRRRAPAIAFGGLLVLGAVAAVLAVAGVFSGGDQEQPPATPTGGDAAEEPAEQTPPERTPPKVVATIPAGEGPDGIAVDGNTVWVSNARGNTLTRLDANLNSAVGDRIPVGTNPDEVEAAEGVVWVSNTDDGTVTRVDVEPGEQTAVTVGAGPEGLSLGEQLVWVANGDSDSVSRLDRAAATVLEPQIPVQNKPIGVFVGKDTVWVTNSFSGTVSRIDSSTAEVLGTTDFIAKNIRSVIEAFGFVWVTSAVDDGTVSRLDPDTGEIVGRPIPLGDRPKEMAMARGFLWVVNERSNNVMRINPETAKVVGKPIRVGNTPVGIAAGARSLWVTNNRSDNVTRINPGSSR